MTPSRFLFLLASTRRHGNSELLAQRAAEWLPPTAEQHWLNLLDYPLPDFVDLRPTAEFYPAPTGSAKVLLDATLAATDVVLVSPLYWYSLSVPAKHYLDHWSGWLRVPGVDFKAHMAGKTLWAVVASSGTAAETAPLHQMLQLSAAYMHMRWGGLLLGNGSRPGDVLHDTAALTQAPHFFSAGVSS